MANVDTKSGNSDQRLWKKFGLNQNPFALAEQGHIFLTAETEEYLDLLPQFARFCNTLLIICGDMGIGKTALMSQFIQSQSLDTQVLAIDANDCVNVSQLMQLLHSMYGAPYDSASLESSTVKLDHQLHYLLEHRQSRLLIIDNAEKLPLEMRQACLQIVQQQSVINTCLPVILVGSAEIVVQMNALLTPTTAQECLHILSMHPLDREQTEEYCRWAWQMAGGDRQHFPFSDEELEQLYFNSRGVLRDINRIAPTLLMSRPSTTSWGNLLQSKLSWWIFAGVGIIISLFVYRLLTSSTDTMTVITKPNTSVATSVSPASPPAPTPPPSAPIPAPATPAKVTPVSAPANPVPVAATTPTLPTKPSNQINEAATSVEPENTQSTTPAPELSTTNTATTTVTPAAAPVVEANQTTSMPNKKIINRVTTPKMIIAGKQDHLFNNVMDNRIKMYHQRVNKMNPHDYTLQLMASENLKVIQSFVLKHQLQESAMVLCTRKNGGVWYVVVYGSFPDAVTAKREALLLPAHLKNLKPWARSYESLQKILAEKGKI